MRHRKNAKITNVTKFITRGNLCEESLFIKKCLCGFEFNDWEFEIPKHFGADDIFETVRCPNCGTSLFFEEEVKIYSLEIK